MTFMSSNPFLDARTYLICFQVFLFGENNRTSSLKICHVLSFYALQVSFEKNYYTFADEPDNFFGQD